MSAGRSFTVLSREWCHLCHELVDELDPIAREFGWAVTVLDVDADPELEAKWDEAVPVLLHGEHELCRYRLDAEGVRAYCQAFPLESAP